MESTSARATGDISDQPAVEHVDYGAFACTCFPENYDVRNRRVETGVKFQGCNVRHLL